MSRNNRLMWAILAGSSLFVLASFLLDVYEEPWFTKHSLFSNTVAGLLAAPATALVVYAVVERTIQREKDKHRRLLQANTISDIDHTWSHLRSILEMRFCFEGSIDFVANVNKIVSIWRLIYAHEEDLFSMSRSNIAHRAPDFELPVDANDCRDTVLAGFCRMSPAGTVSGQRRLLVRLTAVLIPRLMSQEFGGISASINDLVSQLTSFQDSCDEFDEWQCPLNLINPADFNTVDDQKKWNLVGAAGANIQWSESILRLFNQATKLIAAGNKTYGVVSASVTKFKAVI